jgi:hypothetical protein
MSRRLLIQIAVLLVLALTTTGAVLAATYNIDPDQKWAWGTNVGWFNFNPTHGGVTVFDDHLEGYAWAENIGWIKLGTCDSGSPCTYANTSPTDYGVNNDGSGNLSGYAWSTNAGWINFNPTHGGVTIDPNTGAFNGYAWAENVGWISFSGGAPPNDYGVETSWTGELDSFSLYLPIVSVAP